MFTTSCNAGTATCNCAVAVRSGRDVFIISKCDGFLTKHMFSCEDNAMTINEKARDNFEVSNRINVIIS